MLFPILLNIITLAIVGVLIYALYKVYKFREDPDMTASEIFREFEKEPSVYSHRMFTEPQGPIGNFVGYTWEDNKLLEKYAL